MHKPIRFIAAAALGLAGSAQAQNVGVSIQVGQPGFYGRIDIGNAPPPPVVVAEPIWVTRGPVRPQPVYLRVPPGHQKHWEKHCHRYDACGHPVYFVREEWYAERYGAREDEDHGHGKRGHGHGKDKHRDRD